MKKQSEAWKEEFVELCCKERLMISQNQLNFIQDLLDKQMKRAIEGCKKVIKILDIEKRL